uniref:Uncharacterized protein n=1 Tax=Cyclophora tenuis TaxID=216820 RepID=A0A7S1D598_CYCTE|mmetsp:Transcript_20859/g.35581  ORF Transcript_20859/g.35581 Transcript_20859/m.35581 type:complete len:129 (+) Transcript_20859:324-710(+)
MCPQGLVWSLCQRVIQTILDEWSSSSSSSSGATSYCSSDDKLTSDSHHPPLWLIVKLLFSIRIHYQSRNEHGLQAATSGKGLTIAITGSIRITKDCMLLQSCALVGPSASIILSALTVFLLINCFRQI